MVLNAKQRFEVYGDIQVSDSLLEMYFLTEYWSDPDNGMRECPTP